MTSYSEARNLVFALLPDLPGWKVYTGALAKNASPPWVVISFSEYGRDLTESVHVSNHYGRLDIRVVGESDESIGIVCEKLQEDLDGSFPGGSLSCLMPERDSGTYAAELISPNTGSPFVMRVLTWTTGWSA